MFGDIPGDVHSDSGALCLPVFMAGMLEYEG